MSEPTPLQLKEFQKNLGQLYLEGFIASSTMHRRHLQAVMDCIQSAINNTNESGSVKRALQHDLVLFKRLHDESVTLDKTITATYEAAKMEGKYNG